MTSQAIMLVFTVVYCAAMMWLSYVVGKRTTDDETEFMVGGREFSAFMTAVGNGSILISGGYLPAIVMYGYMFGMGGAWYYIGWGTGALVAWLCWAGFWRTTGALTPTEWFEYRYGKTGRMGITVVILFASLAILGWQYVGCGATIGAALGISSKLAMAIVGGVVTIYVVFGGIWAATATDVIQFSWVVLIQFLILPIYLLAKYGPVDVSAIPEGFLNLPFGTVPIVKFVVPSVLTFLMMHQSLLNQSPYWTRAAGTRSLKACKRGWMWTWIIAYSTGIIGAYTGCYARQLLGTLQDNSAAFGSLMNILPIPLAACVMAGLMAATMSTCDIYLVSGVNQLVRDVAQYFLKITDTKTLLKWAKWGTILYSVCSIVFAICWKTGLSMLFAFGTGVGAPLFVYYLDSWWMRIGNKKGAISSVVVSLLIVLYWEIIAKKSAQVNTLWLIFPICFIVLVVVSLLTRKDERKSVVAEKDEYAIEILKTMKRGYLNAGLIFNKMTQFNTERKLQAATMHHMLDSLELCGYITRDRQHGLKQLYFHLTEKGEAVAVAHLDAEEVELIHATGLDRRCVDFLGWLADGETVIKKISGKHHIFTLETGSIAEHLVDEDLIREAGTFAMRAILTEKGKEILTTRIKARAR